MSLDLSLSQRSQCQLQHRFPQTTSLKSGARVHRHRGSICLIGKDPHLECFLPLRFNDELANQGRSNSLTAMFRTNIDSV